MEKKNNFFYYSMVLSDATLLEELVPRILEQTDGTVTIKDSNKPSVPEKPL